MEQTLNNFYITGFGRSGTTFLSSTMNKSKQWTVKHEARGYEDKRVDNLVNIKKAFQQPYYGEVNAYLRFYLNQIPVDKVGVILRDTKDIYLSMCNRWTIEELEWRIHQLHQFVTEFKPNIPSNVHIIEFNKMTTDKEYLYNTLLYFGINDIDMNSIDLVKVNSSTGKWYNTWDELPKEHIKLFNSLEW